MSKALLSLAYNQQDFGNQLDLRIFNLLLEIYICCYAIQHRRYWKQFFGLNIVSKLFAVLSRVDFQLKSDSEFSRIFELIDFRCQIDSRTGLATVQLNSDSFPSACYSNVLFKFQKRMKLVSSISSLLAMNRVHHMISLHTFFKRVTDTFNNPQRSE